MRVTPLLLAALASGAKEPSLPAFDISDWVILEAQQIEIVTTNSSKHRRGDSDPRDFSRFKDRSLCAIGSERDHCNAGGPTPDLVTNGAFYDGDSRVMGVTVRRGVADNPAENDIKFYTRGALAQLKDGSFALCSPDKGGPRLNEFEFDRICSDVPITEVSEVLHGGALLIQNGKPACSDGEGLPGCDINIDLYRHQHFDNGGRGFASDQMRSTKHTVYALKNGRLFVAWPRDSFSKSGRQIQKEFLDAGFDGVIKFDGGSGFFVRGDEYKSGNGSNPSGVLVKLAPQ